jgi:N utilization substance protein B
MPRRSRAREVALQVLHQLEYNPVEGVPPPGLDRPLREFLRRRLRSSPLVEFATGLVEGVARSRDEIDRLLDARSDRWRVSRMAATDRTVLRIAVHELVHTATPGPVVVDEAIDLARRYGSAASPRFVAGILGGMLAEPPVLPISPET